MMKFFVLFTFLLAIWSLVFVSRKKAIYIDSSRSSLIQIVLMTIILCYGLLLGGMKPDASGSDTSKYLTSFAQLKSFATSNEDAQFGSEFFFWPLQYVFKSIFEGVGFFELNYIFTCLLGLYSYKKLSDVYKLDSLGCNVSFSVYSFLFLTFFLVYNSNIIRQAYAMPLLFLSYSYLEQNKRAMFVLTGVVASLFHLSAATLVLAVVLKLFKSRLFFYFFPPLMLIFSSQLISQSDYIVTAININEINDRGYYYLQGGRDSHIDNFLLTGNFWISTLVYYALLVSRSNEKLKLLSFVMYIPVAALSFNADLGERYNAYYMFMIPFFVAHVVHQLRFVVEIKNYLYVAFFSLLSCLVLSRGSTSDVLGLLFRGW